MQVCEHGAGGGDVSQTQRHVQFSGDFVTVA